MGRYTREFSSYVELPSAFCRGYVKCPVPRSSIDTTAGTLLVIAAILLGLMTVWSGEAAHTAAIVAIPFMTCRESSCRDRPHRCRRGPGV
jgi:hypothetical protein